MQINNTWREQELDRLGEQEEREQERLGLARVALAKACHVNDLNAQEIYNLLELVDEYKNAERNLQRTQDALVRLG